MVVLKVSQEDVLGILTKMDQYLFGKCNLMYFLILDNFVYRIQSLKVQSHHINYNDSICRITFRHTCNYRHQSHAQCECCKQGNASVTCAPLLVGSGKESETVLYLFDFLFVAAGARLCTFSTLCIYFL